MKSNSFYHTAQSNGNANWDRFPHVLVVVAFNCTYLIEKCPVCQLANTEPIWVFFLQETRRYKELIKTPMDLSIVKRRLESRSPGDVRYVAPDQFITDGQTYLLQLCKVLQGTSNKPYLAKMSAKWCKCKYEILNLDQWSKYIQVQDNEQVHIKRKPNPKTYFRWKVVGYIVVVWIDLVQISTRCTKFLKCRIKQKYGLKLPPMFH